MRYFATVNGATLPEFSAKGDRAAVDAVRDALPAEGDHEVTVSCLDTVLLATGDERGPCQVSSFSVRHEPAPEAV